MCRDKPIVPHGLKLGKWSTPWPDTLIPGDRICAVRSLDGTQSMDVHALSPLMKAYSSKLWQSKTVFVKLNNLYNNFSLSATMRRKINRIKRMYINIKYLGFQLCMIMTYLKAYSYFCLLRKPQYTIYSSLFHGRNLKRLNPENK
jgi:hypothetical protein